MNKKSTIMIAILSLVAAVLIVTLGMVIWNEFSGENAFELPANEEARERYGDMVIIRDPESCSVTNGEQVTFYAEVAGADLTYRWEKCDDGETWKNSSSEGADTARIQLTAKPSLHGMQFRCVVTNKSGDTLITEPAQLLVDVDGPAIKTQPKDIKAANGDKIKLAVVAYGDDLTYQWQKSTDGKTWNNCTMDGNTESTYVLKMKESYKKLVFRCVITDHEGKTINTRTVKVQGK